VSAAEHAPSGAEPAPILLLAGFPDEDDETVGASQLLEIEEAILSLSRAALARGHRLTLPGDPVVAPLVVAVATEYAAPAQTEARSRPPWLVDVLVAGEVDEELSRALTGRRQVRGVSVGEGREGTHEGRHRLTAAAMDTVRPAAAVLIGGDSTLAQEFALVRAFGVRMGVIGPTLTGDLARGDLSARYDVAAPILERIGWGAGRGREVAPDHERQVPYPFVMQQLVAEWEDEWRGPSERQRPYRDRVEEDEEEMGLG
jgi:hypothetical protein